MKESRRGYRPGDERLFGEKWRERMLLAASETRWLINRGYNIRSAVTFTGNHYLLSERQRAALLRSVMTDGVREERLRKERTRLTGDVVIDGFNTVITLETALSGSVVLRGDDGAIRDVAALHGSYRLIDKTAAAVDLMLSLLREEGTGKASLLLDRPVSNSGRLRQLILERAAAAATDIDVMVVESADEYMKGEDRCVVSSDGPVLDRCRSWFNLLGSVIADRLPEAWVFDFS